MKKIKIFVVHPEFDTVPGFLERMKWLKGEIIGLRPEAIELVIMPVVWGDGGFVEFERLLKMTDLVLAITDGGVGATEMAIMRRCQLGKDLKVFASNDGALSIADDCIVYHRKVTLHRLKVPVETLAMPNPYHSDKQILDSVSAWLEKQ